MFLLGAPGETRTRAAFASHPRVVISSNECLCVDEKAMRAFKNFRIRGGDKKVRKYIKDLCEQIVRVADPVKIVLFGSYAYGKPTEDSDIDLLVIMPFEGSSHDQAFKIRMQVAAPMALDLLVRTPEFVAQRIAMGDFFMQDIVKDGKVIYEADYPGVDRQGGGRLEQRAA